ncbi:MAG: FAD-dependent oxidoreductase [Pseudomonadota bacterium]
MSIISEAECTAQSLTIQQAIDEAHRCLLCHDAPCSQCCPGGTDPGKFIRQIRFYNLKGAARTVLRNNPLGTVCAHVCPTEETCVGACLRAGMDRPIDIEGLQNFAAEYGREHGVHALEPGNARPERIAIIGAGPAGLVAAARLATFGYKVTIFEAQEQAGGMLRYGIPKTRLPESVLKADLEEILSLGVELHCNKELQDEGSAIKLLEDGFAAVFVAPGLWKPYELTLPGIDLQGVTNAIKFLGDMHNSPDKAASLVKDKNIAIIGGGSVAMDVALGARELGAKRIYAIALESMTELPAQEKELAQARQDGVIFKPQCQLTRIVGDKGNVSGVEGVETEWIKTGKLTPDNARPIEGTSFRLRVGAVIQAIGQGPSEIAQKIVVSAKKTGALLFADKTTQSTSVKRIFAGGDIVRGAGTVIDAVGDGKRAADAIHQLLSKNRSQNPGPSQVRQ